MQNLPQATQASQKADNNGLEKIPHLGFKVSKIIIVTFCKGKKFQLSSFKTDGGII